MRDGVAEDPSLLSHDTRVLLAKLLHPTAVKVTLVETVAWLRA